MSIIDVGSLFSGIGGLDLGLERAGMRVAWQSEVHPYACRVLAKHWPTVPNLGDIREIDWRQVPRVRVLVGGFPCQDISSAHTNGRRMGLDGTKSGLWRHMREAVSALAPQWIITENVSAWQRWVPKVRADLARLGWSSVPLELPAGSFGAPHRRPRVLVVAHAHGDSEPLRAIHAEVGELSALPGRSGPWASDPNTLRMDDGLPNRMDRLHVLGNAVVPDVAEWVGNQILHHMTEPQYR